VRYLAMVVSVVLLVAIGTIEAGESARQLADQPGQGRPTLAPGGAALTVFGLVLSLAVYGILGWVVARDRGTERFAVWTGVVVGIFAGLIGLAATACRRRSPRGRSLSSCCSRSPRAPPVAARSLG